MKSMFVGIVLAALVCFGAAGLLLWQDGALVDTFSNAPTAHTVSSETREYRDSELDVKDDNNEPTKTKPVLPRDPEGGTPSLGFDAMAEPMAELRAELRALRSELAALRGTVQRQADSLSELHAGTEHADSTSVDDEALQIYEEQVEAAEVVAIKQHYQQLGASFDSESQDVNWGGSTVNLINSTFDDIATKSSRLISTDCRSTLCRVEVEHDSDQAQAEFEAEFSGRVAQALPKISVDTEVYDGIISSIFYMARDGYDLPNSNI